MKRLFLIQLFLIYGLITSGQTTRYVKSTASGTSDGSSWANASADLQAIIDASTANDIIWIASGTYLPIQAPDGTTSSGATDRNNAFHIDKDLKIYGGFAGTETLLTQRNVSSNNVILSGDFSSNDAISGSGSTLVIANVSENAYHVLITANLTSATVLDGFTISGGFSDVTDFSTITYSSRTIRKNNGGGMFIANSDLTMNGVIFRGNGAYSASNNAAGGGLYISTCAPTITNCIFDRNTANYGGGIHIYSGTVHAPVLNNITVSGNLAQNGGRIENSLGANTVYTNCIVWGNHATSTGSNLNVDSGTPTTSYSIIEGSGGSASWNSGFGTDGGNNLDTDPLLRDATNGNFTLQGNSPAINVGTATNMPTVDIINTARPQGTGHDIGAYEYFAVKIYVKSNAGGANDGSSWTNAYTDLQAAIDAANVNDTIWIASGTYLPIQAPDGTTSSGATDRNNAFHIDKDLKIYGGFAGTETLLTQRNVPSNNVILSGDFSSNDAISGSGSTLVIANVSENAYHVLITANLTSATVLDGFTISGGLVMYKKR